MSKKKKKTASTGDGLSKKRYTKDDKEQSQQFVETAKELGVDKTGESFEQAMDSIKNKKD